MLIVIVKCIYFLKKQKHFQITKINLVFILDIYIFNDKKVLNQNIYLKSTIYNYNSLYAFIDHAK